MKRYQVEATYTITKEMVVIVADDSADPFDSRYWTDIESEHDTDCSLYDIRDAVEVDDQHRPVRT